jgi:hypothetical protein
MTTVKPPISKKPSVNKRTLLGGHYLTIGAVTGLTPGSAPIATLLVAVGAYILLEPRLSSARRSRPFRLLLSAE